MTENQVFLLLITCILAATIGFLLGLELSATLHGRRQRQMRTDVTRLNARFTELQQSLLAKDDTRAGIDIGTEYVLNAISTYITHLREKLQ